MRFAITAAALLLFSCVLTTGQPVPPLDAKVKVVVLVFVSADCPISNRIAPELERIHQRFSANDVGFWYVYPNADESNDLIQKHRQEYHLTAPSLRDPSHKLVKLAGVKVTPEAAVFDQARNLAYRGRVNDQFLAFGKAQTEPTTHDLAEAIAAVLAGRSPAEPRTRAVGCYIEEK